VDLIRNAVEAMAKERPGLVTLRARHNPVSNRVEVEVADTGLGLPETVKPKLFTLGSSTKDDRLGIGLWWCKTFMQATGGDLTLHSTSAEDGTTFLVEIPCAPRESLKGDSVPTTATSRAILVVEDKADYRLIFSCALEGLPHSVVMVEDYAKAKEALARQPFRIALLDIRLTEDPNNYDGLRLLDDIERSGMDTKVILMTSFDVTDRVRAARRRPNVIELIGKGSYDPRKLRGIIQSVLADPIAP
jgi:CheY-like chemotaxis protein